MLQAVLEAVLQAVLQAVLEGVRVGCVHRVVDTGCAGGAEGYRGGLACSGSMLGSA